MRPASGRALTEQPASYPARERGEATAFGGQYGASRPGPNARAGCDRAGGAEAGYHLRAINDFAAARAIAAPRRGLRAWDCPGCR